MAAVPYRMWAEYLKLLLIRQECPALKLLDVCCGTGTLAEMLTLDGYSVTGFDLSEGMIEAARAKPKAAKLGIRYEVADARSFVLDDTFEAAYSFFDSLNYIAELEGFRSAIQQVAKHLSPGGAFIFDLNTAFAFETKMFDQKDLDKKTSLKYKWEGAYDPGTRVIKVHMEFLKDGQTFQEVHVQRAHSDEEVRQALDDAGFDVVEVFESYTIRKPRRNSDRVHYSCRLRP